MKFHLEGKRCREPVTTSLFKLGLEQVGLRGRPKPVPTSRACSWEQGGLALGQQTQGSRPGSGTCHDFDLRGSPIGTELCNGTATGAVEFCVRIRNQDSGFSHPSSNRLSL